MIPYHKRHTFDPTVRRDPNTATDQNQHVQHFTSTGNAPTTAVQPNNLIGNDTLNAQARCIEYAAVLPNVSNINSSTGIQNTIKNDSLSSNSNNSHSI